MASKQFADANRYVAAFQAIESEGIPENHLAMLKAHYNSPAHTTTMARLAHAVGYKAGSGVNLQYGKLAVRIGTQLGFKKPPNGFWLYLLVDWASERDAESGHSAFVLRPPVIKALRRLGWIATCDAGDA